MLSVASYNFLRWHKNARVVTAFLLDFILCYLLTDKAVQFAVERDTTMQIFEAFIWTFGDSNAILLVSLLLLILFGDKQGAILESIISFTEEQEIFFSWKMVFS